MKHKYDIHFIMTLIQAYYILNARQSNMKSTAVDMKHARQMVISSSYFAKTIPCPEADCVSTVLN